MDDLTRYLIYGLVGPLVVAGAALLLPRGTWLKARPRCASAIGVAAVALPMPIAFALIHGFPNENWERLILMTLAGAIAASVIMGGTARAWRNVLAGLLAGGLASVFVWPVYQPQDTWLDRLLPGVCIAVLVTSIEPLARRDTGSVVPISLWIAAIGSGAAVLWMGQLPFVAAVVPIGASMLAIGIAAGLQRPVAHIGVGAVGVPAIVMAPALAYLWMSALGSSFPMWITLVPASGVLAAWCIVVPWVHRQKRWFQCMLAWVAVATVSSGSVLTMALCEKCNSSPSFDYELPDFMQMPMD